MLRCDSRWLNLDAYIQVLDIISVALDLDECRVLRIMVRWI
jgi:hypothetical protein